MRTRISYFFLMVLLLSSCSVDEDSKPNIIIILADDLGYGDISANGSSTINTHNIDKLASEGVRFTNGYSTSATSTSSRYGLLTGMYPWRNTLNNNFSENQSLVIGASQYTLPRMLKDAGYTTAAVGKWHLGMGNGNTNWNETIKPGANEVGFDYSNLIATSNDLTPTVYVENGNVIGLNPNDPIMVNYGKDYKKEMSLKTNVNSLICRQSESHGVTIHNGIPRKGFQKGGESALWKDEEMAAHFLHVASDFIVKNADRPFFLLYGLHQPGVPRAPNKRFEGLSGMGPRGDAILEADWCVGELIRNLKELNLLEKTIIIFTSDNGPVLNDGYEDQAVELLGKHKPTGDLRGGKYSLYDAGTRVPFVISWRRKIKPAVSDALICQLDLMASLSTLIGKPLPGDFDSENMLPVLLGKRKKGRSDLIIEANGKLAFREGDWVFIPPYKGPVRNSSGNELGNLPDGGLFDLKHDPGQIKNLIYLKKNKMEKMKLRLQELSEAK